MQSSDGMLTVTFNGEIYNHIELRAQLKNKGYQFKTHSDTEVILYMYAEYGTECVQHFNGQWALAIWDERRRALFLSRDRLGIRPLFYADGRDKLLFASEIKALLTCPDVPRELDPRGLKQLFTFWTTLPPTTVFRGVRTKLPSCSGRRPVCSCSTKRIRSTPGRIRPPRNAPSADSRSAVVAVPACTTRHAPECSARAATARPSGRSRAGPGAHSGW